MCPQIWLIDKTESDVAQSFLSVQSFFMLLLSNVILYITVCCCTLTAEYSKTSAGTNTRGNHTASNLFIFWSSWSSYHQDIIRITLYIHIHAGGWERQEDEGGNAKSKLWISNESE